MKAEAMNKDIDDRKVQLMIPKKSSLRARLRTNDALFYDFIRHLLEIDPDDRPTARKALEHPFIQIGE